MNSAKNSTPLCAWPASERLLLGPIHEDDLPTLERWFSDVDFLRHLDVLPAIPRDRAALQTWVEEANRSSRDILLGIRQREDARLIVYVEFDGILWPHGVSGVGLAIGDADDRGQGKGCEAMRLALALAFDELGLHRLSLTIFEYNSASIALAESLGFTLEGRHRDFLLREGRRHDMLLYGLLHDEWRERG